MSLQCDNLSGELQDQWSSSFDLVMCKGKTVSNSIWCCILVVNLNSLIKFRRNVVHHYYNITVYEIKTMYLLNFKSVCLTLR